jgi:hypothetical protein
MIASALVAAALTLGGAVAANAAPVATLTSNSPTASVNGHLTLTAAGFAPSETLSFTLDSSPLTTYPVSGSSEITDATGQYAGDAVIPTGTAVGPHTITVTGSSSTSATTVVTVVAQPTSSVTPSTTTLSDYLSKGVTATFSGFTPGSTVSFGISNPGMGDQAGPDALVGPTGVVTLHYVPTAGTGFAGVGSYYLSAGAGSWSVVAQTLSFDVTPNPVAPAAPVAAPAAPVKHAASFTG